MVQKVNMKQMERKKTSQVNGVVKLTIHISMTTKYDNTQLTLVSVSNYYSQYLNRIIRNQISVFSIASRNPTINQLKTKKTTNPIFST